MRRELESALNLATTLKPDELPFLLGDLEVIRATAHARMTSPAVETRADERVDVNEAARRLGVSKDYLYRNWRKFKFAQQEGRKVLFSSNGIDAHLKKGR